MDFSISPAKPIQNVNAAFEEIALGVEGQPKAGPDATSAAGPGSATPHADATTTLVQGGFVERVLGETQSAVAALPAQAAGERVDKTVETNSALALARPQTNPADLPRPIDTTPTPSHHGRGEFALPEAQLVPAALIGLQVDHPTLWPMTTRGYDPMLEPTYQARVEERNARPEHWEDEFYEEDDTSFDDEPAQRDEPEGEPAPAETVVETPDEAWCAPLNRALQLALAARVPPRALVAADEQWRRGRCIVLACPQGADPSAGAWAFVLWPRRSSPADGAATPTFTVTGTRIEARLQWSAPPVAGTWLQTRVMKQHHPRTGRQLVPATMEATGRVPCEVQLGPVLARPLRACDVCLKVGAVRRLWNALGSQWSLHVVVSAIPLVDDGTTHTVHEEVSR